MRLIPRWAASASTISWETRECPASPARPGGAGSGASRGPPPAGPPRAHRGRAPVLGAAPSRPPDFRRGAPDFLAPRTSSCRPTGPPQTPQTSRPAAAPRPFPPPRSKAPRAEHPPSAALQRVQPGVRGGRARGSPGSGLGALASSGLCLAPWLSQAALHKQKVRATGCQLSAESLAVCSLPVTRTRLVKGFGRTPAQPRTWTRFQNWQISEEGLGAIAPAGAWTHRRLARETL